MNYSPEVQALNAGLIHSICNGAPNNVREKGGGAARLPIPRFSSPYWWASDGRRVVRVEAGACGDLGLAGPLASWSVLPVWSAVRVEVEAIDWRGLGWSALGRLAWRPFCDSEDYVVNMWPVRFGDCWFNSGLVRPFALLPGCEWRAVGERLALRWPGGVGLVMLWEFGSGMETVARRSGLSSAEFPYSSGGAE